MINKVEDAEGQRSDRKEVHRGDSFSMVTQERKPAFCRFEISRRPYSAGDGSLGSIKAEQESPVDLISQATDPQPGRVQRWSSFSGSNDAERSRKWQGRKSEYLTPFHPFYRDRQTGIGHCDFLDLLTRGIGTRSCIECISARDSWPTVPPYSIPLCHYHLMITN